MYKEHPVFKTPLDSAVIWRYMSFAKFVSLIANDALYFSRLDQYEDLWEGLLPRDRDNEDRMYIRYNKYINCWHMNDSESDAMWKLYGNHAGETVAIKTNVGRLKKALEKSYLDIYIGKIMYEEQNIPEGNLYYPVLFKRRPFRHEEELRLCISGSNCNPPDILQLKKALTPFGFGDNSDQDFLKQPLALNLAEC